MFWMDFLSHGSFSTLEKESMLIFVFSYLGRSQNNQMIDMSQIMADGPNMLIRSLIL